MQPIVNGLEAEFAGQITVQRLRADEPENEALMATLGLRGHPAFAIIDEEGRVRHTFFGPQETAVLRAALADVAAEP